MATLGEGNGKVNKSARKELHMISNIGGGEGSVRKELNDVKISHFSYLTSTVTVSLLYGSGHSAVSSCTTET